MQSSHTRATDSSAVVMHLHADICSASEAAKYLKSLGMALVEADLSGISIDHDISVADVPVLLLGQEVLNWPQSMAALASQIMDRHDDRLVILMTNRALDYSERQRLTCLGNVRIASVMDDHKRLRDMIRDWMRDLAMTGFRVLLVEDSRTDAYLATKYMESIGLEVMHIRSPWQVLEAIDSFQPDLIISDLHMDGSSGDEMTVIVRQDRDATMPIIFLSAEGDSERQMHAIAAGANGFIRKPLRIGPFLEVIKSTIRRSVAIESRMRRDPLTNLFNRAQIFSKGRRIVEQETVACIAIIDIDHFKRVNDTYGHPVGDQVICAIGRVLEQGLRSTDFIGRLGGEEFALLMPDCPIEAVQPVLDRLRETFAGMFHIAEDGQTFQCTFSAGVTLLTGDMAGSYKRADEALYVSKQKGRNRITVAP